MLSLNTEKDVKYRTLQTIAYEFEKLKSYLTVTGQYSAQPGLGYLI